MTRLIPVLVLLLLLPFGAAGQEPAFDTAALVVETASGAHAFTVEMAVSPRQRERGLQYRESLAADSGMLFDFGFDRVASMWMKNTLISLDMVFIDRWGRVVTIARDTPPRSLDIISSRRPVRAVLELNAGTATAIGLKTGDRVRHGMFEN
ncbi:MAG: DUF192 domain-containing protein [Rhodobacterales bacterium]|nr:DUF192 domain-containing protein [Rhodobacterales bacterium]